MTRVFGNTVDSIMGNTVIRVSMERVRVRSIRECFKLCSGNASIRPSCGECTSMVKLDICTSVISKPQFIRSSRIYPYLAGGYNISIRLSLFLEEDDAPIVNIRAVKVDVPCHCTGAIS